jgi:hypothetical protein
MSHEKHGVSKVSAASGLADGRGLREEKILNFAKDGPPSASLIKEET